MPYFPPVLTMHQLFATLHHTTPLYTILHHTSRHFTALHYNTLDYSTLNYITYTTPHYTTLHIKQERALDASSLSFLPLSSSPVASVARTTIVSPSCHHGGTTTFSPATVDTVVSNRWRCSDRCLCPVERVSPNFSKDEALSETDCWAERG